jgi:nicotinamide mononucleotide transporter
MTLMEWIGFVTGVICVYLIVRERDVNWPIGVVNSLALMYVLWVQKIYGQAWLQIFYVIECFYGWWAWTRRDRASGAKLIRIGRTRGQTLGLLAVICVVGTGALYALFQATQDPAPFWDSLIVGLSLVAEYMLCLKLLQGWSVYLAADLISLVLFARIGIWVTFGTYLCFTALCIMGLFEWRTRMRRQSVSAPASSLASSIP